MSIFKTVPFAHQLEDYERTKEKIAWAQFHEQGTGKSKIIVDTIAHLYRGGEITGALIVAPNAVHQNWRTEEIPIHLADDVAERTKCVSFLNARKNTKWHKEELKDLMAHDGLRILTMPYSGFMTKEGKALAWEFIQQGIMLVLDESSEIKNPGAKRTKSMVAAGKYPLYKRILDGTPVAQSPFDIYSPIRFLDNQFWKQHNLGSAQVFRHFFGEFATNSNGGQFCVGYHNLHLLNDWIKPISSRVLKEDVLDLPERLYSKAKFDMTRKQREVYDTVKEEYRVELNGMEWDADLTIVRQLRLQQIACGYLPTPIEEGEYAEPFQLIDKENPRLDLLADVVSRTPHAYIVWARFRIDIDLIVERLGDEVVRLDGRCSEDQREEAKRRFKEGEVKGLVANPAVGGAGLTLNRAKTMWFYSNSFKPKDRLQAEDRNHRIGQDTSVLVTDLMARSSIDYHIVDSLRKKRKISAQVLGDREPEWL